jgi:hypothetical protein
MKLFSRRNTPVQDIYRYDIDEHVRSRLLLTLKHCVECQGSMNIRSILNEVEEELLRQYGGLRQGKHASRPNYDMAIIDHFFACPDEEVMDFIQVCFHTRYRCGGQSTVDAINGVLEEEDIGYELTSFREEVIDEVRADNQPLYGPGTTYRTIFPTMIRKDEKLLHCQAVQPCLHVLNDPRFVTANTELLNAFEEYRKGNYADAITDAGAAVESVLKTICAHKRWRYDHDKDTCAKLLDICRTHDLFYSFYRPILEATAMIRNKIGDAHGKGPKPEYPVAKELADHMLNTVCTNIVLLISLAKL